MRVEIPKGRTPPDWVYRYQNDVREQGQKQLQSIFTCWIPAICLVMYSTVTGSSTVKRWLWHSIRALSINTRPSAVSPRSSYKHGTLKSGDVYHVPANARQTWSSSITTLRTVRESWSCKIDFFSTPRTTTSFPRTPTAQVPFRTASRAYSTYHITNNEDLKEREMTRRD